MTLEAVEAALREMAGIAGEIDRRRQRLAATARSRRIAPRSRRRRLGRDAAACGCSQSGRNGGYGAGNNVGIRAGLSGGGAPGLRLHPELRRLPRPRRDPPPGRLPRGATPTSASPAATSTAPTASRTPPPSASRRSGASSRAPRASARSSRLLARHVVPLPIPEATAAGRLARRRERDDAPDRARRDRPLRRGLLPLLRGDRPLPPRRAPPAGRPSTCARARSRTSARSRTGMKAWARTPELLVRLAPALLRQEPRGRLRRRRDAGASSPAG